MAGTPSFTRSKRYHHFHTSHKTTFAGSETQHVKSNLTASVDGDYELKVETFTFTASNVKIDGNLYVTGSKIVVASVLHMGNNIFGDEASDNHKFVGTTTASGDMNVSASLLINRNASIDGNLNIGASLDVVHNVAIGGDTAMTGSLLIDKNASIDGVLNVGGLTTLTGSLLVDKNASIDGALNVGGAVDFEGALDVAGKIVTASTLVSRATASLDGDLNVGGLTAVMGSLLVDRNASVDGNLSVGASLDVTHNTAIGGDAAITGSLLVDKNASIDGALNIGGLTTLTGSLLVDKNASVDGALSVGGTTTLAGVLHGKSTASLDGNLNLTGSLLVDKNASIDGTLSVGDTTDLKDNKLTGVQGGNVFHCRKDTVDYTSFTATGLAGNVLSSQDIELFVASPGMVVSDILGNLTTPFWSALGSKCYLLTGHLADPDGFTTQHSVGSTESSGWFLEDWTKTGDKGVYLLNASYQRPKVHTIASPVTARFCATGCHLASLTAGAVDIYTFFAQCE